MTSAPLPTPHDVPVVSLSHLRPPLPSEYHARTPIPEIVRAISPDEIALVYLNELERLVEAEAAGEKITPARAAELATALNGRRLPLREVVALYKLTEARRLVIERKYTSLCDRICDAEKPLEVMELAIGRVIAGKPGPTDLKLLEVGIRYLKKEFKDIYEANGRKNKP